MVVLMVRSHELVWMLVHVGKKPCSAFGIQAAQDGHAPPRCERAEDATHTGPPGQIRTFNHKHCSPAIGAQPGYLIKQPQVYHALKKVRHSLSFDENRIVDNVVTHIKVRNCVWHIERSQRFANATSQLAVINKYHVTAFLGKWFAANHFI